VWPLPAAPLDQTARQSKAGGRYSQGLPVTFKGEGMVLATYKVRWTRGRRIDVGRYRWKANFLKRGGGKGRPLSVIPLRAGAEVIVISNHGKEPDFFVLGEASHCFTGTC